MDLYKLGYVSWWESQCYYHALAHLGREGLIICAPDSPYVCLGLHDDFSQEIDLTNCNAMNLPILRREVGGGVVYLDKRQIFYQLVLNQDNKSLPFRRDYYYPTFLKAPIEVYRKLGIPAEYKPPADLTAEGAKCSGNAAGDIGLGVAFVGNILLNFDYTVMAKLLKVPHPFFRQYLEKSMRNNMTTLADWTNNIPTYEQVADLLGHEYAQAWGELKLKEPDQELKDTALKMRDKLTGAKWLAKPGRKTVKRKVKISEGLYLHEGRKKSKLFAALVRDDHIEEFYLLSNNSEIDEEIPAYKGRLWSEESWEEIS